MEDVRAAGTKAAEELLDQPETRPYLVSILRVAFLQGVAWAQEQRLNQLKSQKVDGEEVVANANS